jgi:hypothetical protein
VRKHLHVMFSIIPVACLASCIVSEDDRTTAGVEISNTHAVESALIDRCSAHGEADPAAADYPTSSQLGWENVEHEEDVFRLCTAYNDPLESVAKRARCYVFCGEWGCDNCCAGPGWIWCHPL